MVSISSGFNFEKTFHELDVCLMEMEGYESLSEMNSSVEEKLFMKKLYRLCGRYIAVYDNLEEDDQ